MSLFGGEKISKKTHTKSQHLKQENVALAVSRQARNCQQIVIVTEREREREPLDSYSLFIHSSDTIALLAPSGDNYNIKNQI